MSTTTTAMTIEQMLANAAASAQAAAPAPAPQAAPVSKGLPAHLANLTPEQMQQIAAMLQGQQAAAAPVVTGEVLPAINHVPAAAQAAPAQGMVVAQHQPPAVAGEAALAGLPAHIAAMCQPAEFDMDMFMSMGLSADHWVKFSEYGISLASAPGVLLQELEVEIELTNKKGYFLCQALKYGNPAVYNHTFDNVTDKNGQPWPLAIATAMAVDPKARPYRCVQLPMKLAKDVLSPTGQVLAHKGEVVGYSTATTAWDNWASYYRQAQLLGLVGTSVRTKVTNLVKQPKAAGQKPWGIPVFTIVTDDQAAA